MKYSFAKNTLATKFIQEDFTPKTLIKFFSTFKTISNKKAIPIFSPATFRDNIRRDTYVISISDLVYDIDCGQPAKEVHTYLQEIEIPHYIYSTYSSGNTLLKIDINEDTENLTENDIQEFFGKYIKIKSVVNNSSQFEIICDPIEKFRLIIPLEIPFIVKNYGEDAIQVWKKNYIQTGKHLHLNFDKSCSNPGRIFYIPAKKTDATKTFFLEYGILNKRKKYNCFSYEQIASNFLRQYQKNFSIEKFIIKELPHLFLRDTKRDSGGYHIKCIQQEKHTDKKDLGGTFVSDSTKEFSFFVYTCMHNSCQDFSNKKFIEHIYETFPNPEETLLRYVEEIPEISPTQAIFENDLTTISYSEKTILQIKNLIAAAGKNTSLKIEDIIYERLKNKEFFEKKYKDEANLYIPENLENQENTEQPFKEKMTLKDFSAFENKGEMLKKYYLWVLTDMSPKLLIDEILCNIKDNKIDTASSLQQFIEDSFPVITNRNQKTRIYNMMKKEFHKAYSIDTLFKKQKLTSNQLTNILDYPSMLVNDHAYILALKKASSPLEEWCIKHAEKFNRTYCIYASGAKILLYHLTLDQKTKQNIMQVTTPQAFKMQFTEIHKILNSGKQIFATDYWLKKYKSRATGSEIIAEPNIPTGFQNGKINVFPSLPKFLKIQSHIAEDDISPFCTHIKNLWCNNNEEIYDWVMSWFAHMIQHPEKKPSTYLILQGGQGVGKSIIFEHCFLPMLGKRMLISSQRNTFIGKFNSELEGKILAVSEEAFFGGDPKNGDAIKHLVSGRELRIEPKGLEAYSVTNHLRLILLTNHLIPALVEWDDRRMMVLTVSSLKKENIKYHTNLREWFENGGINIVYNFLSKYTWNKKILFSTINTRAKQKISASNIDEILEIFYKLSIRKKLSTPFMKKAITWNDKTLNLNIEVWNAYIKYFSEEAKLSFFEKKKVWQTRFTMIEHFCIENNIKTVKDENALKIYAEAEQIRTIFNEKFGEYDG